MKLKEYIYNNSKLRCDKGSTISDYNIQKKKIKFNNQYLADIDDNISGVHLKNFGVCSITGKECQVEKSLSGSKFQWIDYEKKMSLNSKNNLTRNSICLCPLGGKIKLEENT